MAKPENIYQLQKAMRPVIGAVQRIFTDDEFRGAFSFLACTAIEDAKGKPMSLRIDLKHPSDTRSSHSHTIMVTPALFNEEQREEYMLREARKLAKSMKYRRRAAAEAKQAGLVPFADIEDGSTEFIEAGDDVGREDV